jgi:hypothetical protein
MKVTLMLADSAQEVNGKLYILGGGWSITSPEPGPFAIAGIIQVPWDQTNRKIAFKLSLVTADGHPVRVPTPTGDQPVEVAGEFEVGRPPGLKPGTPMSVPLALNMGPWPLQPDTVYVWRLSLDGREDEDWQLSFVTRPRPTTHR